MSSSTSYYDTMVQLVQHGKCWTDKTFMLREMLIHHQLVTRSELDYLDGRWNMYDRLLSCSTWQELMVLQASYLPSTTFTEVDWLVLVAGFAEHHFDQMTKKSVPFFNDKVIFKAIDESTLFDDALKNTRILTFVFQSTTALYPNFRVIYAKKLCAHLFKKFPQLAKHSANFRRTKVGIFQRADPKDVAKYLVYDKPES